MKIGSFSSQDLTSGADGTITNTMNTLVNQFELNSPSGTNMLPGISGSTFDPTQPKHHIHHAKAFLMIKIDNNKQGVIQALTGAGYSVGSNITREDLASLLYKIYKQDAEKFVRILKTVPFNENADNYTTSQSLGVAIKNTVDGLKKGIIK